MRAIAWAAAMLGQHASERTAARRVAEIVGGIYISGNIVEHDGYVAEIVWANRRQTGFIAREADARGALQ